MSERIKGYISNTFNDSRGVSNKINNFSQKVLGQRELIQYNQASESHENYM